ncbi:hypothetical protein C0992_000033 [Termitomyces sp. T32_za158]|nr:hypothetical protein C0992_000033 [Termitomyces sp. T32_za158]
MLPSPSSPPTQLFHERTNTICTPVQTKLPFVLPTPPADKPYSPTGLLRKRKLSFSSENNTDNKSECTKGLDSDGEVEEDATPRPRARRYTSFHKAARAATAVPGRRREPISTRAILQSFVSSNKSDVYKCQSSDIDGYLTPPYACSYTQGAKNGGTPILAIATEQGTTHIVNTSKRKDWDIEPPRTTLQVHQNGIFDIKWNSDDTLLATCSGDQSTHITCINEEKVMYALHAHTSTVKCAAWDPNNANLLSTGGRDGTICLWDLRIPGTDGEDGPTVLKPVMTILGAHEESTPKARRRGKKAFASRSITSVLYPETGTYGLVSSGSFDGVIKHWDLRLPAKGKGSAKQKSPMNLYSSTNDPTTLYGSRRSRGIIKLTPGVGVTSGLIFGLGADSRVHVYDVLSLNPLPLGYSHRNMQTNSFYVGLNLSPCGRWLATGSGAGRNSTQGSAFLYDVGSAARQTNAAHLQEGVQLKSQQGEVGAVDWAENMLASCADDGTVRVWRPDVEIYQECIQDPENGRWNWSWHSYSSFAVVGTGYVGLSIIKALIQQKVSVLVITCSPPKSDLELPEGVQVVQFRHSIASIAWALQQHCIEVVISTIDADDLHFQSSVAEVSKGAGVKLFLPSDFGMPTEGSQDSFIAMDKSASQVIPYRQETIKLNQCVRVHSIPRHPNRQNLCESLNETSCLLTQIAS